MEKILFNDINYTLGKLSEEERARFDGSTVLITGCAGFLGYYFMHFFDQTAEELGIRKIIGLDNFMLGYPAWVKKLEANPRIDIRKFDIIRDNIADVEPAAEADLIIHMVQATDSDLKRCADENVPVSVCPSSNLYFGMTPPVGRMLDAGVDVCLGTDNAMLFPSADIFSEARVLARLLKEQGKDPLAAFGILIACGHKVLYHDPITPHKTGSTADITVFPCTEKELLTGDVRASARYGP